MFLSVIIPTCNRNELLKKCLDCLLPNIQKIDIQSYEIIVSDDGTENQAKKLIIENYPFVHWLEGPKKGPAANRNNAARNALGKWLIFLDDDCIPQPFLLNSYKNAAEKYRFINVFEGRIFTDQPKKRSDEEAPLNEFGGVLWSCNFMIKREFFEQLCGFNEAFPYAAMEDVEFYDRVKRIAATLFIKDAAVMHPWRRVKHPFQKFNNIFISHKIYLKVNPEGKIKFALIPYSKLIIHSIFKYTIPEFFKFKGKGIAYSIAYHWFQLRILFYTFIY